MSESRNQISELVAAVEAVGEFGKIARRIFLTPGVVGAVQGPLDVAEHRVHPPQARRLAAARSPSGYPRAVLTTCFLHSPEAGQSVRVDHRLPPQMPVGPGRNLLLAEPFHAAHPQRHRPAFFGDLHGRHERRLALRPSSAFASSGFAPQVGIVHLHDVAQPAALVPFLHHLHQLVLQRPGRVVADSQLGHRRETVLRLGQQIHGEKPSVSGSLVFAKTVLAVSET